MGVGVDPGPEALALGVLGFGEAGSTIASGLASDGLEGIRVWQRLPGSDAVREAGRQAGLSVTDNLEDVVGASDLLVSLVAPEAALEVAQQAAPWVRGKYYLDLNTVTPGTTMRIDEAVSEHGGRFVGGAIMGPLKAEQHHVTILISGPHARRVEAILKEWADGVRAIGNRVDLASSVKMIRSVYTKGLEAAVVEMMIAAHLVGCTHEVLGSTEDLLELDPFKLRFRAMAAEIVREQVPHAARRAREMEQVVATLEELGVRPMTATSSLQRLRQTAHGLGPLSLDEAYDAEDVLEALSSRESAN